MTNSIIVAVVTPVYNGSQTIQECINSVLEQTYENWIHIIINDGSTDNTEDVLSKYMMNPKYRIINLKKNIGRGGARKLALATIKDLEISYMCMLDADDLYYPTKLEWQLKFMEENTEISLLSCSLGYIDGQKKLLGILQPFDTQKKIHFAKYQDYVAVPHASSIIRVKDIKNITFDESLRLVEDQDFMIRFLINKNYIFIPKICYLYTREHSFSLKKYRDSQMFIYRSKKKIGYNGISLFRTSIINKLKIYYIAILYFFNLKKIYFKNIGRSPTSAEIQFHNNTFNK